MMVPYLLTMPDKWVIGLIGLSMIAVVYLTLTILARMYHE